MADSTMQQLLDAAHRIKSDAHRRCIELEQKKARLQAEIAEIQRQLDQNQATSLRLSQFAGLLLKRGNLCPACWIERATEGILKPMPSQASDRELLSCPSCKTVFPIDA